MDAYNPIDMLFGGMHKLGPGADADTRHVLRLLPEAGFEVVVDAGCGAGRQTLVLARELGTPVHAVDSYQPFLNELARRSREAGLEHLIETHCMDMKDIPGTFAGIDLLWSEGAAYHIGFSSALSGWASAARPSGFVVVSELSWLREKAPEAVAGFFASAYPDMRSISGNVAVAESAGYRVLGTHTLPSQAWVDGYYDVLGPRAEALVGHPDASVRQFASEMIDEIEIFGRSEGSYGYVFYLLQNASTTLEPAHR